MKILMVNEKNHFFGGVEQLVNDVSHGLSDCGHEVAQLHVEACPEGRQPLDAPFVMTACADPRSSIEAWRRQVESTAAKFAPDVMYVHRLDCVEALEALLDIAPVVRYVHDHDIYCPRRHKYFPLTTRICSAPLGMSCLTHGCLISPSGPIPGLPGLVDIRAKKRELEFNHRIQNLYVGSRWMRQSLMSNGFMESQVSVVPPIPRGLERESAPMGEEPIVLFVGQVIRGKGVDLLLRALTEVKHKFKALVIGTGNHLDACVKLARQLNLGGKVSFLGWVDHGKIQSFFDRARVVVVPSRWPEPFGMVGLEAMWASRPVVAFEVGGIPDWLDDGRTGLSVAEQDWRAMGQALDQILGDPQFAATLGRRAWRRASTEYRFDDQISVTEKLLKSAGGPASKNGESKDLSHGTDGVEAVHGLPGPENQT